MTQTPTEQKFDKSIERALRYAQDDCPEGAETLDRLKLLLFIKGKEYRRNNDPYHNFNEGAKLTGSTAMVVLSGFRLKHMISINDLIQDLDKGTFIDVHQVNEKFDDVLVYNLIELAYVENAGAKGSTMYRKFISTLKSKIHFIKLLNARV